MADHFAPDVFSRVQLPEILVTCLLKSKMCICIHSHTDITMPHQVLERLGVHTRLCHVAAVGMAADMGRDVRHLHPVDIVVPLDHMVETVFPVHRHQRVAVLIREKEVAVPVNHLFKSFMGCPLIICYAGQKTGSRPTRL